MISLNEFHQDFLQTILADTESRGILKSQAFFENVCEELVSSGDLTTNYTAAEYVKRGIEIHGYDFDEERKLLSLIVHEFFQEDEINTLTLKQIEAKFNKLKGFFRLIAKCDFHEMEPTSDGYAMAHNIYQYFSNGQIDRIRLMILTDGRITKNLTEIESEKIASIPFEYRVVDIEYIYRIYLAEYVDSDFEIEVDLPALQVSTASDTYQSFLAVVPAPVLASIFDSYGQKLFEQNVRTFLGSRGKTNIGLKNTLETRPEMFFAYNNGITATASEVICDESGRICKIKNFQVVNGGQTTSSIYAASRKQDLSKVAVQMKLSVVKDKNEEHSFVSDVSRFANTQNKVNDSDFFSNSQFHKEMKDYSRRIWAPAASGSQKRTHWFYERARGEYLNEQRDLRPAQKRVFLSENPKHQYLDKTFLAKSEVSWLQKPHVVSKGAQESFKFFAENITKQIEIDDLSINELYFKEAVSRVILFREVEKLISAASWYDGGFRAQTVTYTIAYLSYYVSALKQFLNFNAIWDSQAVPAELIKILQTIAEAVYSDITNPIQGVANISQWCKQEPCWRRVKDLNLRLKFPTQLLVDKDEKKFEIKSEKSEKKIESGIHVQTFVVNTPLDTWRRLFEYFASNTQPVSSMQLDILSKVANGTVALPSEKQSKILYELFNRAKNEGFVMESH